MNVDLTAVGDTFTINPQMCSIGEFPCKQSRLVFTIPADLKVLEVSGTEASAYDPLATTWWTGELPAVEPGASYCKTLTLKLELLADTSLPLTLTAVGASDCNDDASDNTATWTIDIPA